VFLSKRLFKNLILVSVENPGFERMNPSDVIIADGPSDFSERGAALFMEAAFRRVREQGVFATALSGGTTPRPIHRRLGQEPYRSALPWDRIHLFWVDERMVDFSDPSSNFGAARTDLLQHVPIPEDHVHPMPITGPMDSRADRFESELRRFHREHHRGESLFDLVLLGIGADGHVASLFPDTPAIQTTGRWTLPTRGGHPNVWRLSLTLEAINAARCICFLASGSEKARIVARILQDPQKELPAQQVSPVGGKLLFLLDSQAAKSLGHTL